MFIRISQTNKLRCNYGGVYSGLSVVSLSNYGIPVEFSSRIPKNDIGNSAMKFEKR